MTSFVNRVLSILGLTSVDELVALKAELVQLRRDNATLRTLVGLSHYRDDSSLGWRCLKCRHLVTDESLLLGNSNEE